MMKNTGQSQSDGERPPPRGGYLIRLDDIAPNMNWEGFVRVKQLFERHGVKPVIGVIPDNRDPDLLRLPTSERDFWDEIRDVQARGWEIAIHGYRHLYDTRGKDFLGMGTQSEFAGHDFETQLERLRRAKAIFERERVAVETFFAPSHTFDDNTIRALATIGVTSICDGYGLYPYHLGDMLFVPQLVGRAIAFPIGVHTSVHHLNHFEAADFAGLERFLERHGSRVLSYGEAKALARDGVLNRLSGALLKKALQAKRGLGALRRGRPASRPSGSPA